MLKRKVYVALFILMAASLLVWLFSPEAASNQVSVEPKTEIAKQIEPVENVTSHREPIIHPPIQPSSKVVDTKQPVTKAANGVYNGRRYSKPEVEQLIRDYSAQYGINPERPLCIAKGESGYQDTVVSPSGKYYGVFQYDHSTWAGTDEAKAGRHILDADANVKAAIKYMASRGHSNPWKKQTALCPYPLHK